MEDAVVDGMEAFVADGLGAVGRIAEGGSDVRLEVSGGVRRDQHALRLRVPADAQRLAESSVAGAVELHVADRPGVDELADRVAMPFPLAMRQGNG